MDLAKEFIVLKSREKRWRSQVKDLEKYLRVSEKPEDDLITVEDTRMSGTCEWFSTKKSYLKWRDFAPDAPSVLWVNGKPAAGKSVLAGYAIGQLQKTNADCSYFFFKYGDKSKSRLSACLRSLAFQMACTNVQVRETLLEMQKDDITFDNDNERTIWRKLFLSGIFQTEFPRHYWVIDALDECVNFASLFDPILAKLDGSIPLRILITSRETSELEKHFFSLGTHRFQSERISTADTLPDIKLLVEAKAKSLVVKGDEDRAALAEKILGKSKGSFLWTVLVLNELSNSYGEEEINQVLDDVPRDMEPLYQRTLELMSQATRGKKLAKAILTWATCARRPLTTRELYGALKLDVKDNFLKLEESIVALCGQLVTVDKFGKVQMVHETAREFLLNDDLESEFAINKTEAHTRIARACLTYLTGEEMKPPRTSRRGSAMITTGKRAEFSLYACAAFSYHLAKADPLANDILVLVHKFLKSNVLSWIEVIAQTQNLIPLIRAAKNLSTYLNSCAAERSPLGEEMQTIRGWTTDLIRIAAKFADALITSPSAIYSLILPFCPTKSTVYKTANPGRRLSVVGLSNAQWDDRLSCIDFHQGQTSAVCHGDEFFAVGLTTGTIALYHATFCQEYKVLNHGEAVKFLQFKSKTDLMASCGMKMIRIWDIRSGEIIHSFRAPQRSIGLAFDKNLLIAASYKNYLASWDLDNDGAQRPNRPWNDSGEHMNTPSRRPPCAISISMSHKMLAVAYSGRPITLWDLDEDRYYGSCGKKLPSGETSTHLVTALVFNPNPTISLLAASYLDGELVLLDPFDDRVLESFRADCHTLAASPDGRLLAGGAGFGTIQIYEFDTLRLLYRVKSSNFYIKQLAFSRDSLHFADIRGSQCNVWEPAVLLRNFVGDDSSEGTSTSFVEAVASDTKVKISAMVLHPKGEVVFCGKDDGLVSLYDLKTGAQLRTLYRHKSLVRILTLWPQSDIIMSVDVSNGIFAWNLNKSQKEGWVAEKILFQSRLDCGKSIIQVLPGEAAGKFILSTRESDHLWSIDGQQKDTRTYSDRPGIRKWIQHQQSPLHMICIEGAAARIYAWSDWSEVAFVPLTTDVTGLQLKSVTPYMSGHRRRILLELSELDGSADTRGLHLLDAASFSIENNLANVAVSEAAKVGKDANMVSIREEDTAAAVSIPLLDPQLAALAHRVAHVVGLGDAGKLVFLDTHSWVCSADLEGLGNSSVLYSRHFFVPYDWFSGIRDVICAVAQRDVLFARNDDVAIVKGGLEYAEKVNVEVAGAEAKGTKGLLAIPADG
jgi:WD40 repeat protein